MRSKFNAIDMIRKGYRGFVGLVRIPPPSDYGTTRNGPEPLGQRPPPPPPPPAPRYGRGAR